MSNQKRNKLKIINDPIYGFITIPNTLIFDIIEHRYFQRLRRVTQMGMSNLVYPGANHTRFHHAIGCMHLMQKAIQVLRTKNIAISNDEANALCIAILLHDIGHGAFSHALEHSIVSGITHEDISLKFMHKLNEEFKGELSLAIKIFEGNYHRKFFNQLISSQLDIDRLDYLKRDSFYTGVAEGNISSERLITMMTVKNDELVIEEKGIYSVEKFIIARRLMYWQVYIHKTCLVAENMLVNVLKRAKQLTKNNIELPASTTLKYFLYNAINHTSFCDKTLDIFAELDDYDVLAAVKEWQYHDDFVLAKLAQMIVRRNLLKIELSKKEISKDYIAKVQRDIEFSFPISQEEKSYFTFVDKISNLAYNSLCPIKILTKKGKLKDIAKASDQLNLKALSKPVVKHYICYPKKMKLC